MGKAVENRSWPTDFRGPVAIHAGSGVGPKWEFEDACEIVSSRSGLELEGVAHWAAVRGAVVAVAELTGVCSASLRYPFYAPLNCDCGEWAVNGQRHFLLADVRPLAEPVPVKGALGLWTLPDEVEAAVLAQVGQVAR
jgi:hypothetical protein